MKWKQIGLLMVLSLVLAACGQGDSKDSDKSISEQMDFTITGLEPGAGQTGMNDEAIEAYDSLDGWEQKTSSTGAMLSALDTAMENEDPIMITAWSPHYMFARWDIKYVEDPKGVFGEEIYAATLGKPGIEDEFPIAYKLLERFNWDLDVVEAGLLKAEEENLEMEVIAQQWVDENTDTIAEWTEGLDKVDNVPFVLGATIWDDALFSGNIAKIILEEQGFKVKFLPVDPAILFEAITTGDADATLSPWLPTTHGALFEEHKENLVEIGKNVEGAKLGLAVPSYMDIDSLEDFEPKK